MEKTLGELLRTWRCQVMAASFTLYELARDDGMAPSGPAVDAVATLMEQTFYEMLALENETRYSGLINTIVVDFANPEGPTLKHDAANGARTESHPN